MVVDTSALLCVLFVEPDSQRFSNILSRSRDTLLCAVNYFEGVVVAGSRSGDRGRAIFLEILANAGISIVPATAELSRIATDAYFRFGKGFHPARLNMGDCFAYALARQLNQPLLFKGNDFARTDIEAA